LFIIIVVIIIIRDKKLFLFHDFSHLEHISASINEEKYFFYLLIFYGASIYLATKKLVACFQYL